MSDLWRRIFLPFAQEVSVRVLCVAAVFIGVCRGGVCESDLCRRSYIGVCRGGVCVLDLCRRTYFGSCRGSVCVCV